MLKDIKAVVARSRATLVQDLIGGSALMVSLVGMLYLPGLF